MEERGEEADGSSSSNGRMATLRPARESWRQPPDLQAAEGSLRASQCPGTPPRCTLAQGKLEGQEEQTSGGRLPKPPAPATWDSLSSAPRTDRQGPRPLVEARTPQAPQLTGLENPDPVYPQVPGWGQQRKIRSLFCTRSFGVKVLCVCYTSSVAVPSLQLPPAFPGAVGRPARAGGGVRTGAWLPEVLRVCTGQGGLCRLGCLSPLPRV